MSIEERIAEVLAKHDHWDYAGELQCRCDESFYENEGVAGAVKLWSAHVASVLVAELGLTEEEGADFTFGGQVRYVTPWEDQ